MEQQAPSSRRRAHSSTQCAPLTLTQLDPYPHPNTNLILTLTQRKPSAAPRRRAAPPAPVQAPHRPHLCKLLIVHARVVDGREHVPASLLGLAAVNLQGGVGGAWAACPTNLLPTAAAQRCGKPAWSLCLHGACAAWEACMERCGKPAWSLHGACMEQPACMHGAYHACMHGAACMEPVLSLQPGHTPSPSHQRPAGQNDRRAHAAPPTPLNALQDSR